MPLRPARVARRGVIGAPVARTAAVVGTAAVVSHGVNRRQDPSREPERPSPGSPLTPVPVHRRLPEVPQPTAEGNRHERRAR